MDRRKSQEMQKNPPSTPNATCSAFLLLCLPEPRWVWETWKPSPPSERGSRGLPPPAEVAAVSAEEESIPRHKNSPTTRQGGAVSEAWPTSPEQKSPHVGRSRGFLELVGAEAVPQVDRLPLPSPKGCSWGGRPHEGGPCLCSLIFPCS